MTYDLQFEIATGWTETLDQIVPGMQAFQKLNFTKKHTAGIG